MKYRLEPSAAQRATMVERLSIMAAGHCRFSLWSGCISNHCEAGTYISIMLIESPEFIHGEDVKSSAFASINSTVLDILAKDSFNGYSEYEVESFEEERDFSNSLNLKLQELSGPIGSEKT